MLRLRAIEVRGYRAFAGWARLELRPLTLLYGRNNAGKSSLLRLLAILADSVEDGARSALELHGEAGRGGKFKDLPWQGDGVPRSAFRLRLQWERDGVPTFTDELELAWLDERSRAVVRELVIRDGAGGVVFVAKALPYPDEEQYLLEGGREDEPISIRWSGMLARLVGGPAAAHDAIISLDERIRSLRRTVTWLDSNRPRPQRLVADQKEPPARLSHDGRNSLELLSGDAALLKGVQAWFAREPIKRDLRFKPMGEGYVSPYLGSMHNAAEFHLLDAGEGMAHVLPVVVGAEQAAQRSGFRVLAVEEPESHLHGDSQRSLARRLAEIAASEDPPIMVLETHSRLLLLGVQLAVAEGLMPHERGQVIWCEHEPAKGSSSLTQVELTREGGLRGWPRVALAEEAEMVRELLDRQDELMEEHD